MPNLLTTSTRPNRMRPFALLAVLAALLAAPIVRAPSADAATLLVVSGTSTATTDQLPSVRSGDRFHWSLTLDLDSVATEPTDPWSRFNDAVVAFTLDADARNAGDWDPSGIVWVIDPARNVVINAFGDNMTVQLDAVGAPDLGGEPFFDIGLAVQWDPSVVDITSPTGPDTLASALGTSAPPVARGRWSFELRNADFDSAEYSTRVAGQGRRRSGDAGDDVPVPTAIPSGEGGNGAPLGSSAPAALVLALAAVATGVRPLGTRRVRATR
jgi:hypothetical protein